MKMKESSKHKKRYFWRRHFRREHKASNSVCELEAEIRTDCSVEDATSRLTRTFRRDASVHGDDNERHHTFRRWKNKKVDVSKMDSQISGSNRASVYSEDSGIDQRKKPMLNRMFSVDLETHTAAVEEENDRLKEEERSDSQDDSFDSVCITPITPNFSSSTLANHSPQYEKYNQPNYLSNDDANPDPKLGREEISLAKRRNIFARKKEEESIRNFRRSLRNNRNMNAKFQFAFDDDSQTSQVMDESKEYLFGLNRTEENGTSFCSTSLDESIDYPRDQKINVQNTTLIQANKSDASSKDETDSIGVLKHLETSIVSFFGLSKPLEEKEAKLDQTTPKITVSGTSTLNGSSPFPTIPVTINHFQSTPNLQKKFNCTSVYGNHSQIFI